MKASLPSLIFASVVLLAATPQLSAALQENVVKLSLSVPSRITLDGSSSQGVVNPWDAPHLRKKSVLWDRDRAKNHRTPLDLPGPGYRLLIEEWRRAPLWPQTDAHKG